MYRTDAIVFACALSKRAGAFRVPTAIRFGDRKRCVELCGARAHSNRAVPMRRRKWVVSLTAVLISFGGGPHAWAQAFTGSATPAVHASGHCLSEPTASHDDRSAPQDGKSTGCCEKGACGCAPSI